MEITSMSSDASTAGWNAGSFQRPSRSPRRVWEIAGIILGFIFMWPLALAYLVWKLIGYPVPNEAKAFFERHFSRLPEGPFRAGPRCRPTGNFAFDAYRRGELERLEQERRRLEEEANAFAEFVEELKRAKDRDEFDSFMAKRRGGANPA
jgi:hypothetical protein